VVESDLVVENDISVLACSHRAAVGVFSSVIASGRELQVQNSLVRQFCMCEMENDYVSEI
jgi:hypothetical protein